MTSTPKEKQHIYEVCIIKREYHYVYIKAQSMDDAEEIMINQFLDDPAFDLSDYSDADEFEVIALDRIKKPSKALKTIN